MTFATRQDVIDIENEMPFAERDIPATVYQMLSKTTDAFPDRPAISYQLMSGPTDKAVTLSWKEFHAQVTQTANLFRSMGVGEKDVVALIMPNSLETAIATLGAMVAGIANPINPLLEGEQIGAILKETNAKVVVTLRAFPKTDVPQKAAEAVAMAPNVKTVLEVDLNSYLTPPKSWIVPLVRPKNPVSHNAAVKSFNAEISRQSTTLSFEESSEDRVGAYFHTGGTTGMPKVAQHRFSGMVYNGWLGHRLLFT
ncbi:MAG: AMP-binding protein, partial [Pseudomonadota bacterium]